MHIQKYEEYNFDLKEITFKEFYTQLGFSQNIIEDYKYTGIYIKRGDQKLYIFYREGIFYLIPMNNNEFKLLEEKYQRRTKVQAQNKSTIIGFNVVSRGINYKELSIIDIMFLYKKLGSSIEVEPQIRVNNCDKYITTKDILNLIKNITLLENEITKRNLRNNLFELIKYIYDFYKMNTYYWIIDNYKYTNRRNTDLNSVNCTANHPYSFIGLINEHYATCAGMSQGLAQLYNYFGIKADVASNSMHSITRLYLSDNNVTYIDLAKEISPDWKDSLYDGWNKRSIPIKCTNKNAYNYFCKNGISLGQIDSQQHNSIDLCDSFGTLIQELNPTNISFRKISIIDPATNTPKQSQVKIYNRPQEGTKYKLQRIWRWLVAKITGKTPGFKVKR